MTDAPSEKTDLPRPVGYVVVLSRVLYSGIASVAITYAIGAWLLAWDLPTTVYTTENAGWFALLIIVMSITVAAGFWVWAALSWGTAYALFPSIRAEFKAEWNEISDDQNE